MRLKVGIYFILVCIIGMCISGCEKTDSCMLKVVSSYSGFGEDGRDLGSGTFTDVFTVSAGDEFYEWFTGHWSRDNQKYNNAEIIISINKIDDNGVTIQIDGEETILAYNTTKTIKSRYVVFDGQNYEYSICFTKE